MIPQANTKYTYAEFLEITKDIERVEFIDGEIIYMSSPSVEHQRILGGLHLALNQYFKDSQCEILLAPLDVVLKDDDYCNNQSVQPDIMIVCDKSKFTKNNYTGVPTIIIEITSPSNERHDTIKKLNLYEKFKVPEYWIVSPKNKIITLYKYQDDIKAYGDSTVYTKDDSVISEVFEEFFIPLKEIFK